MSSIRKILTAIQQRVLVGINLERQEEVNLLSVEALVKFFCLGRGALWWNTGGTLGLCSSYSAESLQ